MKQYDADQNNEELERIKKNIDKAYTYFENNYRSFYENKRFISISSYSAADVNKLTALSKPIIEANTLESFLHKLVGEYIKYEPGLELTTDDLADRKPMHNQEGVIDFLEAHFRHIIDEYTSLYGPAVCNESLSGGFSGIKVLTPYIKNSFEVDLKIAKTEEATMVGYDPMARMQTKSDSSYWFEVYMVDEAKAKKIGVNFEKLEQYDAQSFGNFKWSYRNQTEKLYAIVDYYEKKQEEINLLLLTNGKAVKEKDYQEMIQNWSSIEVPPQEKDRRKEVDEVIVRYRLCEAHIIKKETTEFESPNYVFVDCLSVEDRPTLYGDAVQVTRPFFYHNKGAVRFKNATLSSWTNELENLVQAKYFIAKESMDANDLKNTTSIQDQVIVTYNSYKNLDPKLPVPKPEVIPRQPMPPEIMAGYTAADQTNQILLGTYAPALGDVDGQLSGNAILQGALQSNLASIPAFKGIWAALEQACRVILELIPKYWTTPRSVPVIKKDGTRAYIRINEQNINEQGEDLSIYTNFDPSMFRVKIKAGLGFSAQRQKSNEIMFKAMQAIPLLGQIISDKCLDVIVDNFDDIRGQDRIKTAVREYYKQRDMQQQQQQHQAPDPVMVMAKVEEDKIKQQDKKLQTEAALKQAQISIDSYGKQTDRLKVELEAKHKRINTHLQADELATNKMRHKIDSAIKMTGLKHKHKKDTIDAHHKLIQMHNNRQQQYRGDNYATQKQPKDNQATIINADDNAG